MNPVARAFLITICLTLITVITVIPARSQDEEKIWSGDLSLGFTQSNGNTEKSSLSVSGHAKRMFDDAEFKLKGDIYTSSTDDNTDDQKWSALARYAFDFGIDDKWFNSYQVLADHDRFADIDYRITPSVGIGYWIYRQDDMSWMAETSLGYEMTTFRSSRDDEDSLVALINTRFEKQLFERARFIEDLTLIPSLEGEGFRLKSETELSTPINDSLDLSVKYVVDFDSEPSDGKKKTDTRLVTGIKYNF